MKYLILLLMLCGCTKQIDVGVREACAHFKIINASTGETKCMGHIKVEVTEEME